MDFFAPTRITLTLELSVLDVFLKTVHGGHASDRIRIPCKLSLASHFSTLLEQKFLKKTVLPRHVKRVSDSIGAASTLLASASAPSSIQRGLGRRSVWASGSSISAAAEVAARWRMRGQRGGGGFSTATAAVMRQQWGRRRGGGGISAAGRQWQAVWQQGGGKGVVVPVAVAAWQMQPAWQLGGRAATARCHWR